MAAEPIGSAYVIIRAITSQLAKDIKDGLDKGASDANTDEAGRTLGHEVGESAGDEFSETWTERVSEGIEDSADSRDVRRATDRFGDSINDRLRRNFDRGGEDASRAFTERLQSGIEGGMADVDVDSAAGSLGHDAATNFSTEYDRVVKERVAESHRTMGDDDSVKRGLSGFITNMGRNLFQGFTNLFKGGGAGRGIGTAFGNFLDSIKPPGGPLIQWGVTLGLPALGAVAQTVGALVGSMISILGFLGTAALGAGVAFAGLGAAVAPAFFILKSAFTIESDDLEAFNLALEGTKERWQEVGLAAQRELLPALSEVFIKLEDLIPMFTTYASSLGAIVGDVAVDAADALTREDNKAKIQSILDQGLPIIESLGDTLVTMIDPILSILAAAMPLAQRLADAIGRVADKFATFIAAKEDSGELTETFDLWWSRLEQIGRIVGDLLVGLLNLFNTGADSATPFFDKLEGIAQRFRDFTTSEEGQNKLKLFFDNAWEVANEVFGLIGDIIKLIVGPMGETGGTEGIVNFFKAIREDWLPALVELGTQIGDALKGPAGEFIDVLGEFLASLTESGAGASFFQLFTANLFVLIEVLEILTNILGSEVGGKIAKFALGFLVLAKTFKPILKFLGLEKFIKRFLNVIGKLVAKGIVKGLALLGKGFLLLGKAMLGFFVANPVVLLIAAIVAAVTLLYFHFKPFRDFVDKYIIDPIQRLWEKIGGFEGIINFFKNLGTTIVDFLKKLLETKAVKEIIDFIIRQFGRLKEIISGVIEFFKSIFTGDFKGAWEALKGIVKTAIEGLLDYVKTIGGLIWEGIKAGFNALVNVAGFIWDWLVEKVLNLAGAVADTDWGAVAGKVWGWIVAGFGILTDVAGWIWDWLVDTVLNIAEAVADTDWGAVGEKIWGWIKAGFGVIVDVAGWIWGWLVDTVLNLAGAVADVDWGAVGGKIWEWIKAGFSALVGVAGWIWDWLVDTVLNLAGAIADVDWGAVGGKVWEWIKAGFTGLLNIAGWIWGWLVDTVLGIAGDVVETDFGAIAETIWGWIQAGFDALISTGGAVIGWLWDWISGTIGDAGEDIIELIKGIGGKILGWIKDGFIAAIGILGTPLKWIADAMGGADPIETTEWFQNMFARFSMGIEIVMSPEEAAEELQPLFDRLHQEFGGEGDKLADSFMDQFADGVFTPEDAAEMQAEFDNMVATGKWEDLGVPLGEEVAGGVAAGFGSADAELDPLSLYDPEAFRKRVADARMDAPASEFVTNFADSIGALDASMVPAANKLVDRLLLTLARLHNETTPKVINPFLLKMVDGINKTADASVKATNKLVDRVMLTLSRIGNETTRTMNPFILRLIEAMNRARDLAVSAANRLADGVLLTIGRIGNEVTRMLSPVAGRMTTVLFTAGVAAAASLLNGFKLGTLALILYLQGLDEIIRNNVGDLSNVLFQEGKDLMNGLIRGVKSAVGSTTVNVPLTFAHGGIVPGTGAVPAIVHGGELILNAAQQAALGSNVTRWAGVAATALSLAGQSQRWMLDLLTQMKHESGGNPRAINKWDINWRLGHPSMGLMQVIMPTFLANAGKLVKRGILDPLANIFAAIVYTVRRYGDLGRWRRGGFRGYSEGGIFDRPTLGLFAEAGREALVPLTRPSRALEIMRAAGLDSLVLGSQRDQNRAIDPAVTDVTMLRVDHAEIYDKVDVDIIAARIRRAYTSMGSRR